MKKISQYINTPSRNKIIIHEEQIDGISSIDIGLMIAETIAAFVDDKKIAMRASVEVEKLLNASVKTHNEFGKILALKNIGILLEPSLKIDFRSMLDKYSRNNTLFLQWDGEIENHKLYFLRKEKGIKINLNLKDISHLIL